MLTSLKAFSTEQKLTIDMANGDQFVVDVTDAQTNGTLTFYNIDGTTVDTSANVGNNYYIAAGNGTNIKGVAKIQPQNGVANLSFGDVDLSGCDYTLVQYTGSGDLTPDYASSNWWYDGTGALTKPQDFGLYSFNSSGGINDLKAVKKDVYTVVVNFYDRDMQNPVTPGAGDAASITDKSWIKVEVKDGEGETVGFSFTPIALVGESNSAILNSFKMNDGSTKSYADIKALGYTLGSFRLAHAAGDVQVNSLEDYNNKISDANNPLTEGDLDGYTYPGGNKPLSDDSYLIRVRQADPTFYYVKVDCGENALELPDGVDIYAKVTVSYSSGKTGYGFVKLDSSKTTDGGKTYVAHVDKWFLDGQEMPKENISGHENNVKVELYAVPAGTSVTTPSNLSDGTDLISLGSYIQGHEVESYPNIPKDYDPSTETGTVQRIIEKTAGEKTDITDVVYLKKNEDSFNRYSLEKLLNGGYNVVTLCPGENESMPKNMTDSVDEVGQGDAFIGVHQMGSVLIRGDVTFAAGVAGIADSVDADSDNVIGGYVGKESVNGCFTNTRGDNSLSDHYNFYVGSSNSIAGLYINGEKKTQELGGKPYGFNKNGSTLVSDDYIDWNRLQRVVLDSSEALATAADNSEAIVARDGDTVDVPLGSNVIIDCPDGAKIKVNIVGENAKDPEAPGTVINFLNSGDMVIPELLLNGEVQVTSETGEGMSVVYNYPNCTGTVVGPDASEFGHVVAPKALIKITVGNYSGTMVGNNVYLGGRAEGHLYPYRGEILIGFYGDLEFNKKVNNATPTDLQKYTFALVRLNNAIKKTEDDSKFWEELQTTKNDGGTFTFTDVQFSRQGDYYFKVYEKPSTQEGVTIDETEYLIKVSVNARTTSEGKVIYSIESATYYTIDNADHLLTITEGEEYKNAKVNEDAITKSGSITWNQGSSDENVKMTGDLTFFNTVADASVTLDGTKTLEGQDLTDEQFSFKVKDTTEKSPHKGEEVATGTNNAQGAITFTSITYDSDMFEGDDYVIQTDAETGDKYIELTYSVEEVKPDEATAGNNYTVDGIKYDPSVKTVTVKVTAHIDGGNITAEVTSGGDSISFRNTAEE